MAWITIELWNKDDGEITVIHVHGTLEAVGEIKKLIDGAYPIGCIGCKEKIHEPMKK